MATRVFIVVSSSDKEIAAEVGLRYSLGAATKQWMDEVKVFLFGPAEKLAAHDPDVQTRLKNVLEAGVEVMACKAYADESNITGALEETGIKVVYIGAIIAQLLKDGWASMTF